MIKKIAARTLLTLTAAMAVTLLTTSCLGDPEDIVVTPSCAILSFSIGNITYTYETTATTTEGKDTTYTVSTTVGTSAIPFTIDQRNATIFNRDSIAYGTPLNKVIVKANVSTATSKNNTVSSALITYMKDDVLTAFASGDTLDFSVNNPLTLTVTSSDGNYTRDYRVYINRHLQDPGESKWTVAPLTADIDALTHRYDTTVTAFLTTHSADHLTAFSYPLLTNNNITRDVVIAWNDNPADTTANVWNRLSNDGTWFLLSNDNNPYPCPLLENLTILRYGQDLYAFGGRSIGPRKAPLKPFSQMYVSPDNGITWRTHKNKLTLPDELIGYDGPFQAAVDDDGWCWIVLPDGTAWRGKLNQDN